MIVVDVETGGLDPQKNPLLSIGAVNYEYPIQKYYGRIRPYLDLEITQEALIVNGIDLEVWKDNPQLGDVIDGFNMWLQDNNSDHILAGHNPRFDLDFLQVNFDRCNVNFPFGYRTIDLHTLAYAKFGLIESKLTSDTIYELLDMKTEPKPHNALTGAVMECEAFRRLL